MGNACSTREGKDTASASGNTTKAKVIGNQCQAKDSFGGKSADKSLSFSAPSVLKVSEIVRPDNYRIKEHSKH